MLELTTQGFNFAIDMNRAQQFANRLSAHQGLEFIAIFFSLCDVVIFSHQLSTLQRCHPRLNHHEGFKIQNALDITQGHIEHHAQSRRQGFQEPNVSGRGGKLDVAHTLATYLCKGHFHTALLANNAAML